MTSLQTRKGRTGNHLRLVATIVAVSLMTVIPLPPAVLGSTAAVANAPGSPENIVALSLEQARQLALARSEQLAQLGQAIEAARANVQAAGADKLPKLELSGAYTHNLKKPAFFLPADMAAAFGGASSVEMGGDWDLQAAANLTLNLWTAGRLSSATGMARAGLEASRWQEALAVDALVYNVETAYDGVLLAAEMVAIQEGARAVALENLRVTQEAYDQGQASKYDLLRSRVEAANREAPLVKARNDLHLARLGLLRLCGLDPQTRLELTDPLSEVAQPQELDSLLARMAADSPELQALRHQLTAARLSVDLARAGRGPMVQLQGQYALQGQWDDEIFPDSGETAKSASAALAFSWPIFDGFAAKAQIQGSRANLRQAELELERVTRDRELGVRQAHTNLLNALAAMEGRREAVDLAEETYRLAQVRLDNGLATPLERLDADQALTEARAQLASALYDCNEAVAALKLAVGGYRNPGNTIAATSEETQR